jgi:ribonuclease HI
MKVLNVYVSSQMTSNPGMMTPGGIVVDHKGIIKERYSWEAGYGTNMLVELLGVEQGLRLSCNHQPVAITVFSANLPIIEQLRGTTSARSQNLAGVHSRITELLRDLTIPVQFQWVPIDGLNRWTGDLQKRARQRGLFDAQ